MQREDTKPWYRQFWPWFIIALPASSVVAGLATLWISMHTTDSLVMSSEDGVQAAAARDAAAENAAARLGLGAALEIDVTSGAVRAVLDRGMLDRLPDMLQLDMTHPAFAERDLSITLHRAMPDAAGNPLWSGHFAVVPEGRYYLALREDDVWRLATVWDGQPRLRLSAHGSDADVGR